MHQTPLKELFERVFDTPELKRFKSFPVSWYKRINFYGEGNQELFFDSFKMRERETPLSPDTLVEGTYLVYDVCGHDGMMNFYACRTLDEVEEQILNNGGFLNQFTTQMVVFENGKVKPFEIIGYDEHLEEHVFVKYENEDMFWDRGIDDKVIPAPLQGVRVRWL